MERQVATGIPFEHDPWSRVVGVVGDMHNATLTDEPMGAIYYSLLQGEVRLSQIRSQSESLIQPLPPQFRTRVGVVGPWKSQVQTGSCPPRFLVRPDS